MGDGRNLLQELLRDIRILQDYVGASIPNDDPTDTTFAATVATGSPSFDWLPGSTMTSKCFECILRNTHESGATLWIANSNVDGNPDVGSGFPINPGETFTFRLRRMNNMKLMCETGASGAPFYYYMTMIHSTTNI